MYPILGHHHASMITKDVNQNNYFYQKILGLRRVKMTVNQEDPSMYHIFYGDHIGSPGTELTFFEIPHVGKTYPGTNAITRIGLAVPSENSLMYWKERFCKYDVHFSERTTYAKRPAIFLQDPDGLRLAIVVAPGEKLPYYQAWAHSEVPVEHAILGMGPIEITVRRLHKLTKTLTNMFGYHIVSRNENEVIFQTIQGEIFGEIIGKAQDGLSEKSGGGSIHHLAIRVENEEALAYWEKQVKKRGFRTTGIIDRFYFKSLYFREANGIMFEIATDGPGFTIDRDVEALGKSLDLPPFLEGKREKIEQMLTPIKEIT